MFKGNTQGDLNGFLDAGSHINGELHFEDTFRIDGKVSGKVVSEGDLVIGEGGEVEGEIQVGRLFVSGVVKGEILASVKTELAAGGKVYADIEAPVLVIEEGAFFEGTSRMKARATNVRRLPVGGESQQS